MRTRELLLECKVRLKVESDYALAQCLKIPRERISDYMNERRKPDEYACFRIAEALQRDPAVVIAEIRAEDGEKHAEYFRDFLQRRGLVELAAGALLLTCSASYTPEASAANLSTPGGERIMYIMSNRERRK